jgi:hypothetical protein
MLKNFFFPQKSRRLWDNVEKYGRVGQALWMLDSQGYIYTPRICNTYYFSTASMVTLTLHSVTLYVLCLSCLSPDMALPDVMLYNLNFPN